MSDIQALLSAIDVFSRAPDKTSLETANAWLQDFQHSPEAWTKCNVLLSTAQVPLAAKLFAAQTIRTKVTFDLHQVDPQNLPALRDTLLENLGRYHDGPRNINIQLCLALSGLALQFSAWNNAVQQLIDSFGRNPATVPTLLQFLTVLPEEVAGNTRIPVTDQEYKERATQLLTANSKQVLDLLSMYIQATSVTLAVQAQIFGCLRSWLLAGEVSAEDLSNTSLFPCAFEALASDELFDSAVDVICELIHETQEIDENMAVIQLIVPRVIALKPQLIKDRQDPERVKGYAKIFSEAGETYRALLLQHTETFFPLVEAIGECSAYPDLDIVPITFPFWARLASMIGKKPSVTPLFIDAYRALMNVIIRHLHFPSDENMLTGQEAENFRSFRHIMGDTLKDCCLVLRSENCLLATYQMITDALARGPEAVSWQEVEAPLFALRSMGAEVDLSDQNAVPKIMDLVSQLPNHPRVRYAALLIIARYTEWIDKHPEYINPQLQYIARGFEDNDTEVCAAAGHALKYICQDCKEHLADFLPTLHNFLKTTGSSLAHDDRRQVYEAIGHVISAMPMERAAESLRTFSLDILADVHALAMKTTTPTPAELKKVGDGLDNLEILLHVVRGFGEELPAACQNSCLEAWAVFDSFLLKYGSSYDLTERVTRVLRHGLTLFGSSALPVAPAVVSRMSQGFVATGFSSFIWVAGKVVGQYGSEEDQTLRTTFQELYEQSTTKLVSILQAKSMRDIPDVLEDYVQMLLQIVDQAPDIFFQSAVLVNAFKASMAALELVHTDVVFATLELFRSIFTHDCLDPSAPSVPPKFPIYALAIRNVVDKEGYILVGYLLNGLVGDFPEESTSLVTSIIRSLAISWPVQLQAWIPPVLQQLPTTKVPNEEKSRFLTDINNAINNRQYERVKHAVNGLNRAAKKARDRRQGLQTA
ncbi:hypothetical protein M378DRAFT_66491 [Amanita muscaria Koide BX008]|uniref:Importin N-terminal domain-containing protein n=1 Tax=Amanita muscaria (strain Koide BX008) TaxID=946122 RepID=A0A0C2X986_AMAMK|nr:hypothetical protein M378DRAFT_66491 [Amanita muscaria Koide BX008]